MLNPYQPYEALELLKEAYFLRRYGELTPGGNETWRDWDTRTDDFLMSLIAETEEPAVNYRVHVEFNGTIVRREITVLFSGAPFVVDEIRDDQGWTHYVFTHPGAVTPIDPLEWPPVPGDIWETDDGQEYFTRVFPLAEGGVILAPFDPSEPAYQQSDIERFRQRNPRLIRRRETEPPLADCGC